jgi:hypothetical protein
MKYMMLLKSFDIGNAKMEQLQKIGRNQWILN